MGRGYGERVWMPGVYLFFKGKVINLEEKIGYKA